MIQFITKQKSLIYSAKKMHYDAKTKKVELMGGVLGVYE